MGFPPKSVGTFSALIDWHIMKWTRATTNNSSVNVLYIYVYIITILYHLLYTNTMQSTLVLYSSFTHSSETIMTENILPQTHAPQRISLFLALYKGANRWNKQNCC